MQPVVQSLFAYLTNTDLVNMRQLRMPSCDHVSDYLSIIYLSIYLSTYLHIYPVLPTLAVKVPLQ